MDKKTYEVLVALEERIDDILEFRRMEDDDDMSTVAKAGLGIGVAGAGLAAGRGKDQLKKDLRQGRIMGKRRGRQAAAATSKKAKALKDLISAETEGLLKKGQRGGRRMGFVINRLAKGLS